MTEKKRLFILMGPAVVLLLAARACGPVATVVVTATPPPAAPSPPPETAAPPPTAAPPTESPPPEPTTAAGCTLGARWVADVTVPDNTEFAPRTPFVKTWRVRNSGTCTWEPGTKLVFISGDPMGGPPAVDVPALAPGAQTDVSVNLTAPATPGTYRANYQFQAPDGTRFGAVIWAQIVVPVPATAPPPTEVPTEAPTATPTVRLILTPIGPIVTMVPPPVTVIRPTVHAVEILYDFVAQAPSASWYNNAGTALSFPGRDDDPNGFALWRDNWYLENGSRPARVLETHPKWENGGGISGRYTVNVTIRSGDVFKAKIGFLQGAEAGNARWTLGYYEGGTYHALQSVTKSYNGSLQDFTVSLNALDGKQVDFVLSVWANGPAAQDWAIWQDARIERP